MNNRLCKCGHEIDDHETDLDTSKPFTFECIWVDCECKDFREREGD